MPRLWPFNTIALKHRYTLLLVLILLAGAFIRLRLAMDIGLHQWDERFHALVAKNLIRHPLTPTLYDVPLLPYDYKAWYANHIWLHKQPLPLWLMAASYKLLGATEFVTRLPSLLLSILCIYITYLLGKSLRSKKAGLLSAFFMAVNGLVIEIGSGRVATDHYDLLYMAFIETAVLMAYYNAIKKTAAFAVLSGLLMGAAMLTKWLPCLVVLPVHACFLLSSKSTVKDIIKHLGLSLATCLAVAIPWQLYILFHFPLEARWEYYHHWLHVTEELEGRTGNGYLYFLDKIRIDYSEIIYLPLMYSVYRLVKSGFRDYRLLALMIWILVPVIFFSFVKTKMQGYILFICPALFIITAGFFFELKDKIIKKTNKKSVFIFSGILLVAMIVLPLRYCFERTAFGLMPAKHEACADDYKSLENLPKKSVVLNVEHAVEFMFYKGCMAYSQGKITATEAAAINAAGYTIYVYTKETNLIEKAPGSLARPEK